MSDQMFEDILHLISVIWVIITVMLLFWYIAISVVDPFTTNPQTQGETDYGFSVSE